MPRCLIFGYHGFNNTGAEARLMVIKEEIARVAPGLDVEVATFSPEAQQRYVSGPFVELDLRYFMLQLWGKMRAYDLLVLSEGASFTDHLSPHLLYGFSNAALAASLQGKGVVAYAVDVGVLERWHRPLARAVLNRVSLLMTRAEESRANAVKLGLRVPVVNTADPVVLMAPPAPGERQRIRCRWGLDPGQPYVVISPKDLFCWPVVARLVRDPRTCFRYPFHFSVDDQRLERQRKFEEEMALYVRELKQEWNLDPVLLAMEEVDRGPCERILEKAQCRSALLLTCDRVTPGEIMAVLEGARLLVSTRYHALVLALFAGVPLVSISHDLRCRNLMHELDESENLVEHGGGEILDHLWERTARTLRDPDPHRERIRSGARVLEEKARGNARHFRDWYRERFQGTGSRAATA
ncbi:MAG: polysaccharide pyruvyl transferase family protein [Acidobacteria bacterium]|nr:polysaccharide pyruvyl transferase family protein [Acidobacteriota bacterium]